jgi:outer membrane protein assembly factor BamB
MQGLSPLFAFTIFGATLFSASCHSSGSAPAPTKKWEFFVGKPRDVSRDSVHDQQIPALAPDGTIYAPGDRGLYALNPDGTQKWFFPAPYQTPAMPLHVAMVDDAGNIWFDFTVEVNGLRGGASAVAPDGTETKLSASRAMVSQIGQAPDGTIFVAMDGRAALLPNAERSALARWEPSGYYFFFAQDGTVYASVTQGLSAYGPDHNLLWTLTTASGGPITVGADGTIYLGGLDAITAVNPRGTVKWSFPLPKRLCSSPSVATDGTVYAGCNDGKVYALAPNGDLKWKFPTGRELHATPVLSKNGNIYVAGADHFLYALGPDGKLKWKFKADGEVFAPLLAEDGTIYLQTSDGKLIALEDSESNGGLGGQWPKRGADNRNTSRATTSPAAP